jgi:hypothetical protein
MRLSPSLLLVIVYPTLMLGFKHHLEPRQPFSGYSR